MPGYQKIVVDTSELASSLDDIAGSVSNTSSAVAKTTTSVHAMTAAVCAAEKAAADHVNQNVTAGFRHLISVQLTQRKIESMSAVQAKTLVLNNFNEMLSRLSGQLQGDYDRITARYSKILQQLANALKSRIYNLDKPAFEVAGQGYKEMINRSLNNSVASVLFDQDVQPLGNMVATSRCKDDCRKSMEKLKEMIIDIRRLRNDLDKSVQDVPVEKVGRRSHPVIIMESDDLNVANYHKTDIQVGDRAEQKKILKFVVSEYEQRSKHFSWRESGTGSSTVSDKILGLASKADIDDRLRNLITDLVNHSHWQELEAIK